MATWRGVDVYKYTVCDLCFCNATDNGRLCLEHVALYPYSVSYKIVFASQPKRRVSTCVSTGGRPPVGREARSTSAAPVQAGNSPKRPLKEDPRCRNPRPRITNAAASLCNSLRDCQQYTEQWACAPLRSFALANMTEVRGHTHVCAHPTLMV